MEERRNFIDDIINPQPAANPQTAVNQELNGGKPAVNNDRNNTVASSFNSFAEGYNTIASGIASHAEGTATTASGEWSHAEGAFSKALGTCSHAEGALTKAMGNSSHVQGYEATAAGTASHAEGIKTNSSGSASHAEGETTIASGDYSHAEGKGTDTNWLIGAHIMGTYGEATDPYSWHLANGTSPENKSLAARIDSEGIGAVEGGWVTGYGGYAEMFETADGRALEPGYFVTARGRKIRRANSQDRYVLGVTTATPAVLGTAAEFRWKNKYMTDEWGRVEYKEVPVPATVDEKGNILIPEHKERQPVLNPRWNKNEEYIPRSQREEWASVALMGQVLVRDDGSCLENGYCMVNDRGIATAANRGYRVLERTGANQVLIMLKSTSIAPK